MVFILLIRSLYQLSRPGRAAAQVCISWTGASGLFPPDSWLGHPALRQTGLPPLRGLGAFPKTTAGLWHQTGLLCGACTLWNFKSLLSGSDMRLQAVGWLVSFFFFFDWFLSVVFNQKSLHPKPPIYIPFAKPVPCLRCLCFPSLMLDLCPLQGLKPGPLGLLQKDC